MAHTGLAACVTMPEMMTVKVGRKGQVTLPAAVRRQLGIGPGDRLGVRMVGRRLVLQRAPDDVLQALVSLAPEVWRGVDATEYVRGLRDEWTSHPDWRSESHGS